MMNDNQKTRKILMSVGLTCLFLLCLGITTFALKYYQVTVHDNTFQTGIIQINLNDGKPIITEDEYKFEPGMTVVKDFFVRNESTESIYYKLYFTEIKGDLKDVLEVTIKDENTVLYQGKMSELTKYRVKTVEKQLALNETRELTMTFHYPEEAGNETQDTELTFIVEAEAVQTRNNPSGLFE